MSFRKTIRIQKLQNRHNMVGQAFNTLNPDERRKKPWLGGWAIEPENAEQVRSYIEQYDKETERLLKLNPALRLVD